MAIIYVHGFASSGSTQKCDELKARFPDELVITPSLSHNPMDDVENLDRIVSQLFNVGETEFLLVGSSLGGFYARYVGSRMGIPNILINPAINPHVLLAGMLGEVTNLATGEKFEWTQRHLDMLERLEAKESHWSLNSRDTDVIIARDDEVIDVQATIDHFVKLGANMHVFEEGGHRFNNIEAVYALIEKKLAAIRQVNDLMGDVDI